MALSLPISYEFSVVLKDGAHLLLPSVHPRYLSSAENRCDSCSTVWGEKPNDEDCIEYPFVMIPCQHIVGSACLGLGLQQDNPTCPVCNTRIQLGKQIGPPLHQVSTEDDSSPSAADDSGSEIETDIEGMSQIDDGTSDSDSPQDGTMSIPSTADVGDSSKVRAGLALPGSTEPTDNVFHIAFTPINWSPRAVAGSEGNPQTRTNTSHISAASFPRAHIPPSSSSQPEETQTTPSSSTPPAPPAPRKPLTPLDPSYYHQTIPPPAKAAHHLHPKPRPLSNYVWTMASVQGAIDYCNIQHAMALDLPYLKKMVAVSNYKKGIRGREPMPRELVEGLGEMYGYGR